MLAGCQTQGNGQSPSDLEDNPRRRIGQESQTSTLTESEKDQTKLSIGILGILNAIKR
jgi:hypothetical protein